MELTMFEAIQSDSAIESLIKAEDFVLVRGINSTELIGQVSFDKTCFTNTKQINKVEVNLVDDVGELTEAEFSELAFEITNWIESNGTANTVKLSGEGISLKQDQEKTTHEPVNTEIQLDTTILINQNLLATGEEVIRYFT
ncbi:hypothetical protein VNO77_49213 [Canavalia gladiata]|uniref:Uncharacterized protein n=1 Tax=Canavalia gladiata TaxID=3824 RepID=A0AAN9PH86_CANGL